MPYCGKCGQLYNDRDAFCPNCGAPNKAPTGAYEPSANPGNDPGEAYKAVFDTEDHTYEMNADDVRANKGMAVLSYLGPLVFVAFFANRTSKFVRFHAVQGLNFFIISAIVNLIANVAVKLLSFNSSGLSWLLGLLITTPVGIITTVIAIVGIVNVIRGLSKELPIVGRFKIIKPDYNNYN